MNADERRWTQINTNELMWINGFDDSVQSRIKKWKFLEVFADKGLSYWLANKCSPKNNPKNNLKNNILSNLR